MTKEIIGLLNTHEAAIDEHLDSPEHAETLDALDMSTKDAAAQIKLPDIGAIYHAVRPVLLFAKTILFFKPKWQNAINAFITALDALYPQE